MEMLLDNSLMWANAFLSLFDFIMVVALIVYLHRRIKTGGGVLDGKVGTLTLLFYALLGTVSALGAVLLQLNLTDGRALLPVIQLAAVSLRVAIFLVLAAWGAVKLEAWYHHRTCPGCDRFPHITL